jgi:hypothetical protein
MIVYRIILALSCFSLTSAWLYTLSEGSSSSLSSCQDCVVEYALDQYNLRRPCTWCPATNTCETMNQWTGFCSTGDTYRETCPILTTDLPICVDLRYSFWICVNARPRNANQCDATFVDGFCSAYRTDRVVQVCNGDNLTLETVLTGFGWQKALTVGKNSYGLELNLRYYWVNAGAGENRRRIETTFRDDIYLCNANISPDEASVVKYRVGDALKPTVQPSVDDTVDNSVKDSGVPFVSLVAGFLSLMLSTLLI